MALGTNALNVITAVKYDADLINAVNRMTFLFDPNWQAMGNTLPIAFFYVKDFKEVMESEISQKPLLFYNSQNGSNADAVSGGLLGIVSDNIINKPKKYQMSIIVPRTIDVYLQQSVFNRRVSFADLFKTSDNVFNTVMQGVDITARATLDIIVGLLSVMGLPSNALGELDALDAKAFINKILSASVDDSNKQSIEAMWENRTILRMKYWNGWRFMYVAIESYIPSKEGTADDFYEATLNLTEVPILTVNKERGAKLGVPTTALGRFMLESQAKAISTFLDKVEANTGLNSEKSLSELVKEGLSGGSV